MNINHKLLEILLDLHEKKRSGILRVQKEMAKKQLVLHDGLLVLAESNQPQEHLAWMMVTLNLLPRPKLNEIAFSMKTGKTSEEALLSLSGSRPGDIERGKREQALAILSSILVWTDCNYCLYPGEGLIRHQLNLQMQLPELIIVSIRQAIGRCLLRVPSHFIDRTFGIVENDIEICYPLNQAESCVYSLLKTPRKAADLLHLIPGNISKPVEALLCLYSLGLVSFHMEQALDDKQEADVEPDEDPLVHRLEDLLIRIPSGNLYEILSVATDAARKTFKLHITNRQDSCTRTGFRRRTFLPTFEERPNRFSRASIKRT